MSSACPYTPTYVIRYNLNKYSFPFPFQLVRVLLAHGANPLIKNVRGRRPLEVATSTKIRKLLRSNVIQSDSDGDNNNTDEGDGDDNDVMIVDPDYVTVDLDWAAVWRHWFIVS